MTSDPRIERPERMPALRWAALGGVISAAAVLASAEFVAAFTSAQASPLFAVGSWVVDLSPGWFKEAVIQLFGSADKTVLFIALGALVVLIAAACGVLQYLRPHWGIALLALCCAVAVVAVVTRPKAGGLAAVPTVIGALVGITILRAVGSRLRWWAASDERVQPNSMGRRSFLRLVVVSGAAAVLVGVGARAIGAGSRAVAMIREKFMLPKPETAAPPVPAGARLNIPGLTPLVTPNDDFYRVDTALQVPAVDPEDWYLKITGMVEHEVALSFSELVALPLTERMTTLTCVSNEVGGNLVGNALWLGYPIRALLERAKPSAGADMVLAHSADGYTAGTPLDVLQDPGTEALLAIGMNGEPLPLEHGFPVRMIVPGLYGYVSATKWVVELELTTFADSAGYWTHQGWSPRGPIKTSSRIDTPRSGARLSAGRVAVAGVAWAQRTGIRRVEVRVDDGPWADAALADSVSKDTWRQWVLPWDADAGDHTLTVRATDQSGYTQTSATAPPAPNGATGWDQVAVHVG